MFNLINGFGGQNQPVRQNPDEYAKSYAEQNGISVEEAKAELKSKYGDPQQPNSQSNIFSFGNYGNQDYTSLQDEIERLSEELRELEETLSGGTETGTNGISETKNDKDSTTTKTTTETENDTDSDSTPTNRIKEYKDQTLYKYLKNVRGLSDSQIKALTSDEEKAYKKDCQKHIDLKNRQYYAGQY